MPLGQCSDAVPARVAQISPGSRRAPDEATARHTTDRRSRMLLIYDLVRSAQPRLRSGNMPSDISPTYHAPSESAGQKTVQSVRRFSTVSYLARQGGLEPPPPGLEIRCSIQLSYWRTPCYHSSRPVWRGQEPAPHLAYLPRTSYHGSLTLAGRRDLQSRQHRHKRTPRQVREKNRRDHAPGAACGLESRISGALRLRPAVDHCELSPELQRRFWATLCVVTSGRLYRLDNPKCHSCGKRHTEGEIADGRVRSS